MGEERIIPPPPAPRRREASILEELADPLGIVLWQDVRHLRDWAESAPEVRGRLFNPPSPRVLAKRREARACAAELGVVLDTFAAMKREPLNVEPAELGRACEQVVQWAMQREHLQTAIEFAEAGAMIDPANPKLANVAGRVTREACEFDRSEVWFKRGIGTARALDDSIEQFWGHVGYGKLCKEVGRVKDARRHLNRASRLAWKAGPPSLAASAQHDICALLMVRGHLAEAAERARSALLWYPKSDPRLPFFAADVALLLVLGRRYAAATRLLRPVLRVVQQPGARAAIFALAARAFAGAGAAEEAALMRKRALRLLLAHPAMEAVARWHLADACRLAGDWEGAQASAEMALSLAAAQNDRETERMTRILLRLIAERKPAPPRSAGDLRDLVLELAERVSRWSPRRGRQPGPWGLDRAA
jgi:tetratricopeptide (TPR) repeat protein